MKTLERHFVGLLVVSSFLVAPVAAQDTQARLSAGEREAGWELLFDGHSTAGLRGFRSETFPARGWVIEEGALRHVAGGGGGDIVTVKTYRDFELAFEWKVAKGANSGIMYRVGEDHDATWRTGPEYQILDDEEHHDGKNTSTSAGALYALIAAEGKRLKPVGEWNTGRILLIGDRLEHWVNGKRVVATFLHNERWNELIEASKFKTMPAFGELPEGHIAFQDHGDDVWYRNIKLRDVGRPKGDPVRLFNGKNLEGWTAHLNDGGRMEDVWSVTADGVLVCAGRPVGYLRTVDDYENYLLRVRWRFNPITKRPGNSGVLLRQIGEDKVWPRSIEAQLQSGAAGDFWNIDKYPMQVAEARTNGRNTKRTATAENPIGEWNEYEITVWKGEVLLRVNGKLLNQAWECLETPGKICLQSEGAEIHFQDVVLTPY